MPPRELSVSRTNILFPKAGPMAAAVALVATALLGGCSGRDVAGAEKLAAINAAAERAEKAAVRAEAAAAKLDKAGEPTVVEADPDATEDADDAALAAENEPASTEPDVKT
jgi:hypothetical protein